jgi:hypothetical protein
MISLRPHLPLFRPEHKDTWQAFPTRYVARGQNAFHKLPSFRIVRVHELDTIPPTPILQKVEPTHALSEFAAWYTYTRAPVVLPRLADFGLEVLSVWEMF